MLKEYQSNCLSLHNFILPIHTRINKLSHMHPLVWISKRRKFVFSALEARHLPWRCYLGGGSTRFNPTPNLTEFPQRNTFGTTEFFEGKQFGLWDWGLHFSKLVVSGGSEILSRKTKAFKHDMDILENHEKTLWASWIMSMIYYDPNPNCPRAFLPWPKNNSQHTIWFIWWTWLALTSGKKTLDFWVLDHVPGLRSFSGLMESTATSPFKIWRSKAVGISIAEL